MYLVWSSTTEKYLLREREKDGWAQVERLRTNEIEIYLKLGTGMSYGHVEQQNNMRKEKQEEKDTTGIRLGGTIH